MIVNGVSSGECWTLQGPCGCNLRLERAAQFTRKFDIGTIGTRRSEAVHVNSPLYARFAETLAALDRSVLVVDTRRSGSGGQGSWGPLELATLVPEHWPKVRRQSNHEYMYVHLPILAPSTGLLDRDRAAGNEAEILGGEPLPDQPRRWELFREAYLREIAKSQGVLIGRAVVEHATARGAAAVFLCAEPFVPNFDTCDCQVQNNTYCHRFTLASKICQSLREDFGESAICRIDLSIGEQPQFTTLWPPNTEAATTAFPLLDLEDRDLEERATDSAGSPTQATEAEQDAVVRLGFLRHQLDEQHLFYSGDMPEHLRLDESGFESLWGLHPDAYHRIKMGGRLVDTPRWQQAYGRDYEYTGQVNRALEIPPLLTPLLAWCQESFDQQLNGILVNWYDGELGHYIGKHRDSIKSLVPGSPIITISFGAERAFRLRPYGGRGFRDFSASDGTVFMMPYATNRSWTHEVPHSKKHIGRRISVTFRAFRSNEKE